VGGGNTSTRGQSKDHALHDEWMTAVFDHCDADPGDTVPITPLGLSWRAALSHGINKRAPVLKLKSHKLLASRGPTTLPRLNHVQGVDEAPTEPMRIPVDDNLHQESNTVELVSTSDSEGLDESQVLGTSPLSVGNKTTTREASSAVGEVLGNKPELSEPEDETQNTGVKSTDVEAPKAEDASGVGTASKKTEDEQPTLTSKVSIRQKSRRPPAVARSRSDDTSSTDSSSLDKRGGPKKNSVSSKVERFSVKKGSRRKADIGRSNPTQQGTQPSSPTPPSPGSNKSVSSRSTTRTDTTSSPREVAPIPQPKQSLPESVPVLVPPPPGFKPLDSQQSANPLFSSSEAPLGTDNLSTLLSSSQQSSHVDPFVERPETTWPLRLAPGTPSSNNSTSLFQTILETDERALDVQTRKDSNDLLPGEGEGLRTLAETPDATSDDGLSGSQDDSGGLLGLGSGINVNFFLTGIMDEVSGEEGAGDLLSEQPLNPNSGLATTPSLSISSDPWAPQPGNGKHRSRAAKYGIAVEEEEDTAESNVVQAILATSTAGRRPSAEIGHAVPLMDVQTILPVGRSSTDDEDEAEDGA